MIKKIDNTKVLIKKNDNEILILGTAHVSKESVAEVRKQIDEFDPDCIAIELCNNRFQKIINKDSWINANIFEIIKNKEHLMFLLNVILSSYQKSIGEELGSIPGQEFIEAINIAKEKGKKISLVDRDVNITLKRAFNKLNLMSKIKIVTTIVASFFTKKEVSEKIIEDLKKEDMLSKALDEFSSFSPSLKEVLIDERNIYIANKTMQIDSKKILLIVGLGHMNEIARIINEQEKSVNINKLETINKVRKKNYFTWSFLIVFTLLLLYGIYSKGIAIALNIILYWIIIVGSFGLLGSIIARASLYTMLISFVTSPFTTLYPLVGSGWFAGLTELSIRKPTIKDFFSLKDIKGVRDFRKNNVLRILTIATLVNLFSRIGSLIAIPIITYLIL